MCCLSHKIANEIMALSRYVSNRSLLYINYYTRVTVRFKVILGLRIYRSRKRRNNESANLETNNNYSQHVQEIAFCKKFFLCVKSYVTDNTRIFFVGSFHPYFSP